MGDGVSAGTKKAVMKSGDPDLQAGFGMAPTKPSLQVQPQNSYKTGPSNYLGQAGWGQALIDARIQINQNPSLYGLPANPRHHPKGLIGYNVDYTAQTQKLAKQLYEAARQSE